MKLGKVISPDLRVINEVFDRKTQALQQRIDDTRRRIVSSRKDRKQEMTRSKSCFHIDGQGRHDENGFGGEKMSIVHFAQKAKLEELDKIVQFLLSEQDRLRDQEAKGEKRCKKQADKLKFNKEAKVTCERSLKELENYVNSLTAAKEKLDRNREQCREALKAYRAELNKADAFLTLELDTRKLYRNAIIKCNYLLQDDAYNSDGELEEAIYHIAVECGAIHEDKVALPEYEAEDLTETEVSDASFSSLGASFSSLSGWQT